MEGYSINPLKKKKWINIDWKYEEDISTSLSNVILLSIYTLSNWFSQFGRLNNNNNNKNPFRYNII